MKKGTNLSIDAILGLVMGLALIIGVGLFAFKIPGLFGRLLGIISSGLFSITNTFWSLFGQFLMPVVEEGRRTMGAAITTALVIGVAAAISSFATGGTIAIVRQVISEAGIGVIFSRGFWGMTLQGGWAGIKSALSGMIRGAFITTVAYLLSDLVVVPLVSQYLGPVAGTGVGGGIKGGVTGWFMGGSIASLLGVSAHAGPLGLAVGLTSGLVSSLVKNYSGLNGVAGAAATIGSGAASGAAMGALIGTFVFPGIGTAVGAGIGAIVGGIVGAFNWFFG
jgi:hypothetical protein